jgi:hypothetical protein
VSSSLGRDRPFPGLRPYAAADHEWFFGRTKQSFALYRLLDAGRLMAVVGSSGSGKSSVVRAGLLPLLDKETASEGGRRWRWWEMRPGDTPIARLAEILVGGLEPKADETARSISAARRERLDFLLRKSSFGLIDAIREVGIKGGVVPLVLVDQFEELFRFADLPGTEAARAARREEAAAFVQLLLEASRATDPPVRVVLTMRSDYLGDSARFHGLPEAVTASQFLVPALTRDQRERAIRGPIQRAGGTIADNLVERLLNDSSEELDQLPVLQQALMRTWSLAAAGQRRHLTLADYKGIGGIAGAISRHADDLLKEPELQGRILAVEQVFRALAELDRQGRGIRRPLPFAQLVAEAGVPEDDVRAVVDRFRRDDCSFLVPPFVEGRRLAGKDVVDIGHEALIRRWTRMNREEGGQRAGWLWDETADGRAYRGLLVIVDGAKPGGRATLPFGQLASRWRWWQERPRTSDWAERYDGRLRQVEALFSHSRFRSRLVWVAAVAVALLLAGSTVATAWSWRETARHAADRSATLIWSLLDFDADNDPTPQAVRGLWQLATGEGGVRTRDAFLTQLADGSYRLDTFASAPTWIVRPFGLQPTPGDSERLLLPALAAIAQATDPGQLRALAQAVQALAGSVPVEMRANAVEDLRTLLATSDMPSAAATLAGAVAALLPMDSPQAYVAAIVELLKWPTTVGEATDALLGALHGRVPGAPGKEAGLDTTVAWVAATYPDIDLDSPPTLPESGSTGGAW